MARMNGLRIGIYADVENTSRQGGRAMRYKALRDFACRDGAEPLRLTAYLAYDEERARRDAVYRESKRSFHNALRDHGFKVIEKSVKWYTSDEGEPVSKANSDLDLAVDMLMQSDRLDRVVLVSGDGDFARVVNAVQGKGCRVEVVAFESVSYDLRRECDSFTSGHLIPGLLPRHGAKRGPVSAAPTAASGKRRATGSSTSSPAPPPRTRSSVKSSSTAPTGPPTSTSPCSLVGTSCSSSP
jgi:uncharacterized LabA/DUF88 family protein